MDEITVSDSYTEYLIKDSYMEYTIEDEDVEREWGRTWTIPIPYGSHGFGFLHKFVLIRSGDLVYGT